MVPPLNGVRYSFLGLGLGGSEWVGLDSGVGIPLLSLSLVFLWSPRDFAFGSLCPWKTAKVDLRASRTPRRVLVQTATLTTFAFRLLLGFKWLFSWGFLAINHVLDHVLAGSLFITKHAASSPIEHVSKQGKQQCVSVPGFPLNKDERGA